MISHPSSHAVVPSQSIEILISAAVLLAPHYPRNFTTNCSLSVKRWGKTLSRLSKYVQTSNTRLLIETSCKHIFCLKWLPFKIYSLVLLERCRACETAIPWPKFIEIKRMLRWNVFKISLYRNSHRDTISLPVKYLCLCAVIFFNMY